MQNTAIKKIIIQRVGSPKIFVYLVIWLMFLVFFGTIAQRDSGLYLVQLDYFSSWIKWFGPIPTPSAKFTMFLMTLNLSTYFFRDYIWKIQKIHRTMSTYAGKYLNCHGGSPWRSLCAVCCPLSAVRCPLSAVPLPQPLTTLG